MVLFEGATAVVIRTEYSLVDYNVAITITSSKERLSLVKNTSTVKRILKRGVKSTKNLPSSLISRLEIREH